MTKAKGFWSYVHADDDTEKGRIAELARDVVAQYEMISGDSIELFLDRDELKWGDDWRKSIDESLTSIAFFIPVITPRYFQSPECRRELNYFARRAQAAGLGELIMPIRYINFPALAEDAPTDEAIELVRRFQWEDWTDLRYSSTDSPEYRRAVGRMAERLMAANALADRVEITSVELGANDEDDELGALDLMARMEETFPDWGETLMQIGLEVRDVAEKFVSATDDMKDANSSNRPLAARLTVAKKLATALQGPAGRVAEHGENFTSQLNRVDQGMVVILRQLPKEVHDDPQTKEQACRFFEMVQKMAADYGHGLGQLKELLESTQSMEGMSRDLRAPLKLMRRGLTSMYEGREVIEGWVNLIDESGLECGA